MVKADRAAETPVNIRINHLVTTAISGRPDRARRAERTLLAEIAENNDLSLVFYAFEGAQQVLAKSNIAGTITTAAGLIGKIGDVVDTSVKSSYAGKEAIITPQLKETLVQITANDKLIQNQPAKKAKLPPNYSSLVRAAGTDAAIGTPMHLGRSWKLNLAGTTPSIPKSVTVEPIAANPTITVAESILTPARQRLEEQHKDWRGKMRAVLAKREGGSLLSDQWDILLGLLRAEPISPNPDYKVFFTQKYDGLTFAEIEQMQDLTTADSFTRVSAYLLDIMRQPVHNTHQIFINLLFFQPKYFLENHERVVYENKELFARLNKWQEEFIYQFLFEEDPQKTAAANEIVKSLDDIGKDNKAFLKPGDFRTVVTQALPNWTMQALYLDEKYSGRGDGFEQIDVSHPLVLKAMQYFSDAHPEADASIMLLDNINAEFVSKVLIPLFRNKLIELGQEESFDPFIKGMEDSYREIMGVLPPAFAKDFINFVTDFTGPQVLERVAQHTHDNQRATQAMLDTLKKKGLHFIPMDDGINRIDFSRNTPPGVLGISAVEMTRIGDNQNFEMGVLFRLANVPFAMHGRLDMDGNLRLYGPLENEHPGMYQMLRYIAIATFHDLTIQQKADNQKRAKKAQAGKRRRAEATKTAPADPRERYKRLPRKRQTDHDLIKHVATITKTTPYKVEAHPSSLGGRYDYEDAITIFVNAAKRHEPAQNLSEFGDLLRQMRENMDTISEEKLKTKPTHMRPLHRVIDPLPTKPGLIGEVRYVETWTKKYDVPELTEAEKSSQEEVYIRRYTDTSALSSMNPMMEWLTVA